MYFFYDSVEIARDAERKIEELAEQLKKTATDIGANDHTHAVGITLMKNIFEHFGGSRPKFPIYAYTSKGPFLLEQSEWENRSKYGVQILLKNRITPEAEWTEIEGDIAISKRDNNGSSEALKGRFIYAGNVFDAMMAMGDVLRSAKKDVLIVDPYMDEKALSDFVLMIPEKVQIRLLSDAHSVKPTLHPACTRWAQQYGSLRPLTAKLALARTLHDRVIIVDGDTAYVSTQSLNAIAARAPAAIIPADVEMAKLKAQAYERIWNVATLL
jgi:hypothetical protein